MALTDAVVRQAKITERLINPISKGRHYSKRLGIRFQAKNSEFWTKSPHFLPPNRPVGRFGA